MDIDTENVHRSLQKPDAYVHAWQAVQPICRVKSAFAQQMHMTQAKVADKARSGIPACELAARG